MLRQGNTRPLHWADKTMSVLRADQLETCEKYLAGFPSHCLFDPDCSDVDAESFYDFSFFADEDRMSGHRPPPVLHTISELRSRVLAQFAQEAALLSVEEHELLPARGLVRRLWCRVDGTSGAAVLIMPHQLCASMLLLLASESHKKVRSLLEQVHENIDNTLYLLGAVQAAGPANHMLSLLKDTFAGNCPLLVNRFLLVGYDYVYDRSGNLLLIHPGLAEPEQMMDYARSDLDLEALSAASESVGELENPLYDRMLGLLIDVTRPEITPEDAVEELNILAKQEVPFPDMLEDLSSLLICRVTPEMQDALRDLYEHVPRWLSLGTSTVQ